jgi:hypothetical protein
VKQGTTEKTLGVALYAALVPMLPHSGRLKRGGKFGRG